MPPQQPQGRLHFVLQRTSEEVFEPDSVADVPLVRFAAYSQHHRVFGWVRLRADRLTDLLNDHAELLLSGVEIESLEDGATRSADEVLVRCSELVAVHASGPRGDESLRHRTRTHPIAVQAGNFLIGGHLHAAPGTDPLASVRDRPPMVPLTDAWIEYWSGDVRKKHAIGTIIVNRNLADAISSVSDEDLAEGMLRPAPGRLTATA